MPSPRPHFAKSVLVSCIDDRLVEPHATFIASLGGAFAPTLAGGGRALIDAATAPTALAQVTASYQINQVTAVYLESHTGCGAYALAGVTFASPAAERERLYADLDTAAKRVGEALRQAGVPDGAVTIHTRVVDPAGTLQPRPSHATIKSND